MLELKKGIDILAETGGVRTLEDAHSLFARQMDAESLARIRKIETPEALLRVANAIALSEPDRAWVSSGSEADLAFVRDLSVEKDEEASLALPDHTIHFDLPGEQGRLVDKTFYIVNEGEELSVLARKLPRTEAHDYVKKWMRGIARGKTLLIGFYNRGPAGAPGTTPALEISTSAYVMHSASILYRNSYDTFDQEVGRTGVFFTNLHSEGPGRAEDLANARVFMDRSWLTTFSLFCTYAGNTLLMKKGNHRFAVDLATYFQQGQQLSEHMFITGLTGPDGRKTYFAGAAPSGCGKTTTAMVGSDFIGDDLAQMWIAPDGTLRAVNPEKGIFGIVADVNREGDPYLMKCLREPGTEVIFSNVLVGSDNKPYWSGSGEETPRTGINFQGEWSEGKTDAEGHLVPISHPNARVTLSSSAIANYNENVAEDPAGAPIKVVTYSGRDADTMPPIWVAMSPDHGVAIGASIVSAATATEVGATGVKRQPWANAPFIPGALADYMHAQFELFNSEKLRDKPLMAGLNYFLTQGARGGEGGALLGEKRDVKVWLAWLERLAHSDVQVLETPIGYLPKYGDLKALFGEMGKRYPRELYDKQFSLYVDNILARIDLQEAAYTREKDIPPRLFEVYKEQRHGLLEVRERCGSIATPDQIAGVAV